jgi:ABC-type uncharacterized transport system permease subunit
MISEIHVICFTATYSIVMLFELIGPSIWTGLRRWLVIGTATAGLVAHTWYLGQRVAMAPAAPLASHYDWFVAAAWIIALVYVTLLIYYRHTSAGLLLVPVMLALIGASQLASRTPLASFQAPRFWGRVHGFCLMLGTVLVIFGFLAGLLYLLQSYRLKHKLPPSNRLRLPSLEWLQRINSRSLGISTWLVGIGFISGILGRLALQGEQGMVPWTDPVVLSLAAMFGWLVTAEFFRMVYPAAKQGRKVAYLTLAAFLFLVITLTSVTLFDSLHTSYPEQSGLVPSISSQPSMNSWIGSGSMV